MIEEIEDAMPEKKSTVGEEFVEWAEKYWSLKKNYDIPSKDGDEDSLYDDIKNVFIDKIDTIIRDRLNGIYNRKGL